MKQVLYLNLHCRFQAGGAVLRGGGIVNIGRNNVLYAFGLTLIAGLSTGIGNELGF